MQMYLPTTVLITICSLRTSVSSDEQMEYPGVVYQGPGPLSIAIDTLGSPTIFYPLYLKLTSASDHEQQQQQEKRKGKPHIQSSSIEDDAGEAVTVADKDRVPSHVASKKKHQNMTHFADQRPQSEDETHEKRINGGHASNSSGSSSEQNDNSIGVEYLPTIAVPFLDTLTHGIIGEIQQHVQLIKPGTKWCGEGNKARHYEDVGVLHKTDRCCRNHDKCPYFILSREKKFGLYNDGHFTRSHCDCDASFYDCLKKVNSPFSTGVGITYFNILKMRCFRLEYPVVMCSQTTGWFSKHCIEYIVNMGKRKKWQWFDNHEF